MKLMTKSIEKAARAQYKLGSTLDGQKVVAKFFDPLSGWKWYLMNQDPEDNDYLWGIVKGADIEIGSFSLSELANHRGAFGLGIERDKFFSARPAREVWDALNSGKHV